MLSPENQVEVFQASNKHPARTESVVAARDVILIRSYESWAGQNLAAEQGAEETDVPGLQKSTARGPLHAPEHLHTSAHEGIKQEHQPQIAVARRCLV